MVQDFFHDLMTLVSEVENRSSCQNEEKGILREKCQESGSHVDFFKRYQWAMGIYLISTKLIRNFQIFHQEICRGTALFPTAQQIVFGRS